MLIGANGNLGPIWADAILSANGDLLCLDFQSMPDEALHRILSRYGAEENFQKLNVLEQVNEELIATHLSVYFDGIVYNAGIDSIPGSGKARITDYSIDDWLSVLSVNLVGASNMLNQFEKYCKTGASIVLIGSMYGLVAPRLEFYSHFNNGEGMTKNPAYSASKAGLIALCKQYASSNWGDDCRFNMLTIGAYESSQDSNFKKKILRQIPKNRMANSDDLPGALIFLLSDGSKYMNGQNLVLDGGFTAI